MNSMFVFVQDSIKEVQSTQCQTEHGQIKINDAEKNPEIQPPNPEIVEKPKNVIKPPENPKPKEYASGFHVKIPKNTEKRTPVAKLAYFQRSGAQNVDRKGKEGGMEHGSFIEHRSVSILDRLAKKHEERIRQIVASERKDVEQKVVRFKLDTKM